MNKRLLVLVTAVLATFIVLVIAVFMIYYARPPAIRPVPEQNPLFAYGINIDSLTIIPGEVRNGQNLSMILSSDVSGQMIDLIARTTRDVFDVRKIKPGQKYSKFFTKDTLRHLDYFVYEINDTAFVVYELRDSLRAYQGFKKTDRVRKTVTGSIRTSLYATFLEQKLDLNLAYALSEVYAWTVDFYGLQKGDRFKAIYEEVSVEGRTIRSDKVIAALFEASGKQVYAFQFTQDSAAQYFDETGKSLRRSFLKAPLRFSRISSRFSRSRMHPILKIRRPHYGVDYSAPRGTPVVALGDGRVDAVTWKGGYGKFISIRHNSVYTSTYAHLSGYAPGLRAGMHVQQGQVIGYVGSTGLSTGPHLDFRVYRNGAPADPLKIESPPTDPVNKNLMADYLVLVDKMRGELDSIPW
jgi:murein DD-endopeptidase MepM/ murein hydrolase activator NlpD